MWTHLAVADEPDDPSPPSSSTAYREVLAALEAAGIDVPLRHAANSAGAIAHPDARFDLVRCGIAVYGIPPSPALAGAVDLRPALRLVSAVSLVKVVAAGATVSYGRRYRVERPSVIATVPLGYADGVRRTSAAAGGEVLIGGRRRPIAGTVTMDQLMVDCGDDETVAVGDEVVLIGRQGDDEVPAAEWAERLDTIGYEIVCGIGPRVPRHWTGVRPMSRVPTAVRVAIGAAAAVGAGLAVEKAVVRRVRKRTDPDDRPAAHPAGRRAAPERRRARRRPAAPDRAGRGPTPRAAPRHHARRVDLVAAAPPARRHPGLAGLPGDRLRPPRPRRLDRRDATATASPCSLGTSRPCSRSSTSAARSWSATRWAG